MSTRKSAEAISTPCQSCPLRPMAHFRKFEPDELKFVLSFKSGELSAQAGTTILLDGNNSPQLYTVQNGWRCATNRFPMASARC